MEEASWLGAVELLDWSQERAINLVWEVGNSCPSWSGESGKEKRKKKAHLNEGSLLKRNMNRFCWEGIFGIAHRRQSPIYSLVVHGNFLTLIDMVLLGQPVYQLSFV